MISVPLSECLTYYVAAIISNEGLAVNIDKLSDKWLGELGMCPQATERDVLCPLVLNWETNQSDGIQERWYEINNEDLFKKKLM